MMGLNRVYLSNSRTHFNSSVKDLPVKSTEGHRVYCLFPSSLPSALDIVDLKVRRSPFSSYGLRLLTNNLVVVAQVTVRPTTTLSFADGYTRSSNMDEPEVVNLLITFLWTVSSDTDGGRRVYEPPFQICRKGGILRAPGKDMP